MDQYRKALVELETEQGDDQYTYADLCRKLEKPTQLIVEDDDDDGEPGEDTKLNETATTVSGEDDDDHLSN